MTNQITNESRWSQVVENLRTLNQEKSSLEDLMIKDYLKNVTQTFTLPTDTRLNWRKSSIVVSLNTKNIPIVEVRDWESPRCLNGRDSKDHLAGTSFLVLKEWKNGKTKGTHYLLFDKKTKRVANFYG